MTMSRPDCADPNMWHRSHAYDSRDRTSPAEQVQNQNMYLFDGFPDWRRAPMPSIRAALHRSMCKFAIRWTAHCRDWIRTPNDGGQSSKRHATATDMSVDYIRTFIIFIANTGQHSSECLWCENKNKIKFMLGKQMLITNCLCMCGFETSTPYHIKYAYSICILHQSND